MDTRIAFKEVYDILNVLGTEYINKIPPKMYDYICKNKKDSYITNIHGNTNFREEEISKDALEIITYINLQYWCDEKQKNDLMNLYNEKVAENQKKYNDIFSNETDSNKETAKEKQEDLTVVNNGFWYRIKNFIKRIFGKN